MTRRLSCRVGRPLTVAATALTAASAAGCVWPFQKHAPTAPTVQVQLEGGTNLNPDAAGSSHSVVVTLYQLSARSKFESTPPALLLRDAAQALGDELVQQDTRLTVVPSSRETIPITLAKTTKFLAATADFFSRDGTNWRQIHPIPSGKKPVRIEVRGRQLVMQ